MSETEGRRPAPGLSGDELSELRQSVSALRAEIQSRFGPGTDAELEADDDDDHVRALHAPREGVFDRIAREVGDRVRDFDFVKLYEELRQRAAIPGASDVSAEVDEFGLDDRYLRRARRLIDFLYEKWWRVQAVDAERIPDVDRVLFVSNRSGILPYDGLMISHAVEREHASGRRPRFLVADWLMTLPFSQPALARIGGVRASMENARRLLEKGHWVVAFPEGQKGAVKPFRDRYRLQRFGRGGFVSLALRERAVIVPVAVVGAEEVHPILFQPRLPGRILGAPLPVTPTFPLLGPLGVVPLPSQWRVRFGDPLFFDDVDPEKADDPLYVNRTRETVRGAIQSLLEEEVHRRRSVFS